MFFQKIILNFQYKFNNYSQNFNIFTNLFSLTVNGLESINSIHQNLISFYWFPRPFFSFSWLLSLSLNLMMYITIQ